MYSSLMMVVMMFGIMYFMVVRPQKKQQEKIQAMLNSLKPGDSVVTVSGLHGEVEEIDRTANTIELDCEGIILTFDLYSIARIENKSDEGQVQAEDLGTNEPNTDDNDNTDEE